MEDINVVRVEEKNSEQYGKRKVLHDDNGMKWNVSEKKPFYNSISGPGIYSVTIKEFQGKPYISYLTFKGAINAQNQPVAQVSKPQAVSVPQNNYEANLKQKLDADKKRQDDIRLEFYCGLAKDIAIANKKEGVDILPASIMAYGYAMYNRHVAILEGKVESTDSAQNEEDTATAPEDEPPF